MRYFFDTEFIEDGKTIELISIGIVAENGEEYYAETEIARDLLQSGKYLPRDSSTIKDGPQWIMDNVVPHLVGGSIIKPRSIIAAEIINFCNRGNNWPEFWAYYADYDWVVMCQLFGCMINLPVGWPKVCYDLKQHIRGRQIRLPKQTSAEHNALADARWVRDAFNWIENERSKQ